VAPIDGVALLTVTNAGTPATRWAVYTGDALTNLSLVVSNNTSTNRVVSFQAQAGRTYQIAVDERYPYLSSPFAVVLNVATTFLTQPAPGARIPAGHPYRLTVTNAETDNVFTRVDYYASGKWLGTVTEEPFAFDWIPDFPAYTNVSAVATNSLGQRREAPPVPVTITPSNDNFADAIALPEDTFSANMKGFNALAGIEAGEPLHAGKMPVRSLWWSWTPSYSGRAEIIVTVGPWQPRVAVYTGSALGDLAAVASLSATAAPAGVEFEATAGTTYFIAIDSGSSGSFAAMLNLATTFLTQPAPGARIPAGHPYRLMVTNTETEHALTRVDYYASGKWLGSVTEAPFALDWIPDFPAYTNVSAVATNSLGQRREAPPVSVTITPGNDNLAGAIVLPETAVSGSITGSSAFAGAEIGEPAHAGKTAVLSLWWKGATHGFGGWTHGR
jgi:hypothetical protein